MSGKAIAQILNFGFPGTFSRTPDCIIEGKPVDSGSANIPFGTPVVLNPGNTFSSPVSVLLSTANFAGIAVAEVKQLNTYVVGQDQAQAGFFAADQLGDVLQRGVVAVTCVHGTPEAGAPAYARITTNGSFPAENVGDIRADADGGHTIALPNCSFNTGLIDPNGVTELKIKSINN